MDRKILEIVIHCSDSPDDRDIGLKEINDWHKERGFSPYKEYIYCGYHQVIRRNGTIEIARPDSVAGIHTAGKNSNTLAVCLVGRTEFTEIQRKALLETCLAWMSLHRLEPKHVKGHYEFPTANGKTCPNLDMNKFREELAHEWIRRQNGIH